MYLPRNANTTHSTLSGAPSIALRMLQDVAIVNARQGNAATCLIVRLLILGNVVAEPSLRCVNIADAGVGLLPYVNLDRPVL
eukprot:CAMPEP_0117509638 /NCGR_PEP_ID=MMETSP0784-20121206/27578_1 /TAXON_ID=39447 /ORGANISM="" /LENGTH=81 /DNA_ID=CAMNT_0005305251 /DNA_START=251 /DNA_END=496 /DNA_ORIENTATION=-